MVESPYHFKAKARLEVILLKDDWSIFYRDGDVSFMLDTPIGEREYWPDLLAWRDGDGWVCFEVDGKKGHSTKRDFQKMRLRDDSLLIETDIRTVRISTFDLWGKRRQDDALILKEIDWQLC